MKKQIIFLLLCTIGFCQIFAVPTNPILHKKIQPNGDTICVFFKGDEYGAWYEDEKGDVIALNNDKYWVYVTIENGNRVMTNQIVTKTSIPFNVKKDSLSLFIKQKRIESYIRRNRNLNTDSANNRAINGRFAPLPSSGHVRILTVLVQFSDVKFKNPNTVRQEINKMMNQNDYKHSGQSLITGSLRDYYLKVSHNKLNIESTVIGPYTVSRSREYYGANRDSVIDVNSEILAYEVMSMISNAGDFSIFDNNNDGWVECIHIVFAGNGNEEDEEDFASAIWSQHGHSPVPVNGIGAQMSCYMMTPELYKNHYQGVGVICHELGHAFGLPDFYDTNENSNSTVNDGNFIGTGKWDLMAKGAWNSYRNDIYSINPALPNPYVRAKLNWITPKELSGINVLDTLRPAELDSNSIYKLSTSTPNEYYLLENRQDVNLPGTGLVVYHVSAEIENHINSNDINVTHKQNMYVVDANNQVEKSAMGTPESYGNINSPNATFRSTDSQNMYFTSTSLPSNCAWDGDTTYNKNVCFISEEMIDGEKCIKFVLNPEIEGPDVLCDSAIYSLKHIPSSNVTIEWTYTRPSGLAATTVPLRIGSGQGTRAVCFKRGSYLTSEEADDPIIDPENPFLPAPTSTRAYVQKPYSGFIEIQAKVTLNGETKIWRKTIYMPHKVEMNTLSNNWFAGGTQTITLKSPTDARVVNDITWNIELPGEFPYSVAGSSSITVTPRNGGTARFTATYIKGCHDEYMSHTKTYNVIKFPNLTYTNPASGSVEISVVNGDAPDESGMRTMSMNNQQTPYMGAYRLELWHDVYGKVREMDVSENTPTVTMNLEGLNSGVYVLRLIIDNQTVEASQLIVR